MNTRDKTEWSRTPVREIQCHKVQGYENHDKIELPVLFTLTDDGKRLYDRETMNDYLQDILNSIEEHEKVYE